MAVELITGVPRAGKSYYAVNLIADRCCYFDDGFYVLKDDTILISNIDGLDINHISLTDFFKDDHQTASAESDICACGGIFQMKKGKYGPFLACPQCRQTKSVTSENSNHKSEKYEDRIEKVISETAFQKLREQYGDKKIYIVIDECQQYLHSKFYNRNVFYGFEIHGHYGIDIILVAHHVSKISSQIVNICEYETRVVPRRFQIGGTIQYVEKQGRDIVGRGVLRKRQVIFDLYKSQYFEESRIKKSNIYYYVILCFLISLCAVFYLKHRLTSGFKKNDQPVSNVAYASSVPSVRERDKPRLKSNNFLYSASFSVVDDQIYVFTNNSYFRVQDSPYPVKIIRRSGRVISVLLSGYSSPEIVDQKK